MYNTILSVREKIAYGLGDTGCNFVWQTAMLFLAYFYTDVYGLSPAHMGTMFLSVRIIDGILDPVMGYIADHTRSKHGRYRPFLLWMAVPFGIACIMVFFVPDLGETGKIIYAYVSYTCLMLAYTAINVPYCAMATTLTRDSEERVSLQSWRFALGMTGGLLVVVVAQPLVSLIGQGNLQKGYLGAMTVMGVGAVLLFFFSFANTRERYLVEMENNQSIAKDISLLLKNNQWRILFFTNVVLLTGAVMKSAATMYYVNVVLGRTDLVTLFMTAGMLACIVGALLSGPLLGKYEKVKAWRIITFLSGLLSISIYFIPSSNITLILILVTLLAGVGMSTSPLLWSMMSDLVDYEKSRSNRSLSGLVFSTTLFAIKLGMALAGAIVGWSLAWSGYVGGQTVQAPQTATVISLLFNVLPGIISIFLSFFMALYTLDSGKLKEIAASLLKQEGGI
ncbi:glycoside-pentoside-hexuronide (GPH):cation symporter [Klebsiella pneumoniae]